MESDDGDLVKSISRAVSRGHIVEAVLASTLTLQTYDWLLILPQEVRYIWRASWNWSKILYLLTRYTPFITIGLVIQNRVASNPTTESCKMTNEAVGWLSLVGLDFAEIVLIVRTYAVWKRDKRVGIGLALLFISCQIPMAIIMDRFIRGIIYAQNPYPGILWGCTFSKGRRLIFANWVIITIAEGVDLVLMTISAVNTYHKRKSNLMTVVFRDGIRFYLYIFCTTLTNVLITLLLPIDFVGLGSDIEIVLHSILTCRLMIGIREASQSYGRKLETFELSVVSRNSTVVFAPRPSGGNARVDLEARGGSSTA